MIDNDPDKECEWPACPRGSADGFAMVSFDEGRSWLCLEHGDEDALPKAVATGPVAECRVCGKSTAAWIDDETPLHPHCVARWATTKVSLAPKGAYARRAS